MCTPVVVVAAAAEARNPVDTSMEHVQPWASPWAHSAVEHLLPVDWLRLQL